jgi:integrase
MDKGLSSTYALNAHQRLSKALEDAVREGRVSRNVAKLTDAPRQAHKELHALTVPEAVEVIRAAMIAFDTEPYDPIPAMWAAYLVTGLRKGELIGLEWDRIGDVVDVSWQLQRVKDIRTAPADYEYRKLTGGTEHRGLYLVRPKTRKGTRVIPLPDEIRPIFDRHRERALPNEHGLVFTTPTGKPIDPAWESRLWGRARPQFTPNHVRVHDLRHTTVDLLYAAGVPEDVIQDLVGHSTWAMSRAYRSKGSTARHVEGMRGMAALVSGVKPA